MTRYLSTVAVVVTVLAVLTVISSCDGNGDDVTNSAGDVTQGDVTTASSTATSGEDEATTGGATGGGAAGGGGVGRGEDGSNPQQVPISNKYDAEKMKLWASFRYGRSSQIAVCGGVLYLPALNVCCGSALFPLWQSMPHSRRPRLCCGSRLSEWTSASKNPSCKLPKHEYQKVEKCKCQRMGVQRRSRRATVVYVCGDRLYQPWQYVCCGRTLYKAYMARAYTTRPSLCCGDRLSLWTSARRNLKCHLPLKISPGECDDSEKGEGC